MKKNINAKALMQAHQYLYYVTSRSVWTDCEYDRFCKRHGLDGNGGSDLASDYPQDVIDLANKIFQNPSQYPPTIICQTGVKTI
jgi:hypothetical protein